MVKRDEKKRNEYKRLWATDRKNRGVCRYCGGKAKQGQRQCEKCFIKEREHKRKTYAKRVRAGLCGVCGVVSDSGGVRCVNCLERHNESIAMHTGLKV
jgi:hypothetical protein